MQNSEIITKNLYETKQVASEFAAKLTGGEVVCLYGDLGAGKTTFVQGILHYLIPGKRILSPTFIIVRHYELNQKILKRFLHIDLYRMKDEKEVKQLEFFEFLNHPGTVVAIEWAEKLGNLLPEKRIDIRMKSLSDQSRLITID